MAFRPRLARVARRLSDAAGASPLANGPVAFEDAVPRHRVLHKVVVEPADVDTVIYHGGCYDGVGAAWAAWRRVGDKASYHGMQHRQSPPKVAGKVVALLDIALPWRVMQHIRLHSKAMVVVDHHVTAEADLARLPQENKIFDMKQSGATLAWQFFHDNQPIPDFLRYIEDRDLWNWRLPLSEEVNAAIMAHPATIANFDSIFLGGRERLEELKEEGKHIQKFANRAYQSIASKSVVLRYKSTGHRVAVVNSSVFKSEVGNLLAEREDAEFGLVWHFDHFKKNYWVSMRASRKNTVDVGALASQFGGGGHEKAAAFTFQGSDIDELFEPLPQVSASSTTVVSPTGDDAATAGALAAARIELLPIVPGEQGSGTNAK